MLSTNVLCMKKRKKRSYYISEASDFIPRPSKDKREVGNNRTMMQITEDTPPDMLAGAMDLTIHLPNGRPVKMSVERSTPMMDLLMQITTANQLQPSGHILQALELAPSSGRSDKVLPYKPNTPIGALDTQHVKVVPKNRPVPTPRHALTGHQPFESTFRLQVHLPRNQLYVIRVSQHVLLEDIMKKVCDEKNLDKRKYEFRHPGNLDEVLDPKLTLSDYQITEVYIVSKGTVGLTQAFSSNDIMVLKKEEERKQLQARTGGGVFSLIFKRGKPSMGSGSLSSDNRSISPSHSDDSRSVTPPAIQQQILPVTQPPPVVEKPKPPLRKRRPAPKPPQLNARKESNENPPSQISTSETNNSDLQPKSENGLTICHSRNSSDSSGYHEPSVLSDNCNLSLPRRPKSNVITETVSEESAVENKSNGNLSKMAVFSKSSTSITSRKKKAAPPPPSVLSSSERIVENSEKASLVVASPIIEAQGECVTSLEEQHPDYEINSVTLENVEELHSPTDSDINRVILNSVESVEESAHPDVENETKTPPAPPARIKKDFKFAKPMPILKPVELDCPVSQVLYNSTTNDEDNYPDEELTNEIDMENNSYDALLVNNNNSTPINSFTDNASINNVEERIKPQVVAVIPKKGGSSPSLSSRQHAFSSIGSKRGFKIGSSLFSLNMENTINQPHENIPLNSKSASHIPSLINDCEMSDLNIDIFNSDTRKSRIRKKMSLERHGIFYLEEELSLKNSSSVPSFTENSKIKRWSNIHDLDDISVNSSNPEFGGSKWVVGDDSDIDSLSMAPSKESPPESVISNSTHISTSSFQNSIVQLDQVDRPAINEKVTEVGKTPTTPNKSEQIVEVKPVPVPTSFEDKISPEHSTKAKSNLTEEFPELESDWQYQLPSPPTAFRDLTPTNLTEITNYDTITLDGFKEESVITNPMLYEKLKLIKYSETDTVSDLTSNISEEDKPMLNKLTLENLEKRKSLVYNRELSTSLKVAQNNNSINNEFEDNASKRSDVIHEIEEVIGNGTKLLSRHSSCETNVTPRSSLDKNIPNFKISTYDKPKTNINIFEDDSIRSNVEIPIKTNPSLEIDEESEVLSQNSVETQNTSYRKQSIDSTASDDSFKKPQEYSKYKVFSKNNFYVKHRTETTSNVTRSESFSSNSNYSNNLNFWKPQNPVQRSKSQVALNNYKDEKIVENGTETLSKSNSLFDVSGLQSLEVMRMIQTKLNTPSNSTEHLLEEEPIENGVTKKKELPSTEVNDNSSTKTYKYQGPPAINLSTWSERPKTKVSLKEDTDYRSNEIKTNGIVRINHNEADGNNVSIKINGAECITSQESGNVVIKVGETHSTYNSVSRYSNNSSTVNYRKPLANVNKIETGRPHSISFSSDFDISRVPIVRSVELKKPFKDNAQMTKKSITQINSSSNEFNNNYRNKFKDLQVNGDSVKSMDGLSQLQSLNNNADADLVKRTVHRVNSFAQNRFGPTVVGFRSAEFGNDNTARSRKSWNVPNSYSTLPPKSNLEATVKTSSYTPNNNVPFSQATLRRVEVNKSKDESNGNNQFENVVLRNPVGNKTNNRYSTGNIYSNDFSRRSASEVESVSAPVPPPAPKMTTIKKKPIKTFEPVTNPRDDLLDSIRNFGGLKGLKHVKV